MKEGRNFESCLLPSSSRVKVLNKYVWTNYQHVYEFVENSVDKAKESEVLEPSLKIPEWEEEVKATNELLSGKKESTTASRSPESDAEKKEHEELTKSGMCEIELPKNPCDIRSYFTVSEGSKSTIKQPNKEQSSDNILNDLDNQGKISLTKIENRKWGIQIQKNWITSYFT